MPGCARADGVAGAGSSSTNDCWAGTNCVEAASGGGTGAGTAAAEGGAPAWNPDDCQSRATASVGRVEAWATMSSTRLSRPMSIFTRWPGAIAARVAASSSPVWRGLPFMASSMSCGLMPALAAGPSAATSTTTSRPVTSVSSTAIPSQPLPAASVGGATPDAVCGWMPAAGFRIEGPRLSGTTTEGSCVGGDGNAPAGRVAAGGTDGVSGGAEGRDMGSPIEMSCV